MNTRDTTSETRERLLAAAGEVFAERGFRDATTREICEKASANVAAINYHFGEKEQLYRAVFEYASGYALRADKSVPPAGTAEEQMHAFVHNAVARLFDQGRPAWLGKLVAQEMANPTKMLDLLVQNQIRPNFERLKALVCQIMGGTVDGEALEFCTYSIVAQWLYYFHCGQVVKRLNPDRGFSPDEIERLAGHITQFSITALKGWKRTEKTTATGISAGAPQATTTHAEIEALSGFNAAGRVAKQGS